ncbi:unnamed protein product [Hymenolepis diminuta]|uniref:Activating signal cointegrator 1 complex subunit 1 n=1 Tax=Hymenolepis diminuta TaxID=6216 RepID=A0A0R3SVP2_HYMDI|nr:unnamed protein product [Hymenolepis diminuta]
MMGSVIMDTTENILSPPIVKSGNKLYRKNPDKNSNPLLVPVGHLNEDFDSNERTAEDESAKDRTCHFVGDIKAESGGYVANFHVPPIFYPFVIGPKHAKHQELESEFSCRLNIPGVQSTHNQIKITAKSESNIRGVARRIAWIVSEARPKMKPTHFVCLPVVNDVIKEKYLAFKNEVLKLAERDQTGTFRGIESDLFVSEHKLHFTLATLFLADQGEVRLASQLLSTFMDKTDEGRAFDRSPLCLTIRGVDLMNDDPMSVRVLYMTVSYNVLLVFLNFILLVFFTVKANEASLNVCFLLSFILLQYLSKMLVSLS